MSCPATEALLGALDGGAPDGGRPAPGAEAARRHAARCPRCAAALGDLRRLRALARGALGRAGAEDPVVARALGRLRRRRRALRAQQALTAAAGLLLVAVLGLEPALRVRVEVPPARLGAAPIGSALWGELTRP